MSATQLICHCGKPVERRNGAGRPPRQCLDCREPYRDRKRVKAAGVGYVPITAKEPKAVRGFTLADLATVPGPQQAHYVKRGVPMKAVVQERAKLRG